MSLTSYFMFLMSRYSYLPIGLLNLFMGSSPWALHLNKIFQ